MLILRTFIHLKMTSERSKRSDFLSLIFILKLLKKIGKNCIFMSVRALRLLGKQFLSGHFPVPRVWPQVQLYAKIVVSTDLNSKFQKSLFNF